MIYLSQLGGSWHCWGVDCFDRSLVPFMNGQAWVYPPWTIHIFPWKSMVKRWNLLLRWYIFGGYVSFRCCRQCIFWGQLGYLDGNCVYWQASMGFDFQRLKGFSFFHHLWLPKKTTLKNLSKTSAEKWTNCLPFAIICVLISILLMEEIRTFGHWPEG